MPPKTVKEGNSKKQASPPTTGAQASTPATTAKSATKNDEPAPIKPTKEDKMQAAMDKFAKELNRDSDEEAGDDHLNTNNDSTQLSDEEKELIREELKKTEDEINTLRQVLMARQKHASELKRKLGISPLTELTADINQSLQQVKSSQAYQKTSGVVSDTADTVKNKWNDMRNSAFFKSFESKLGSAYQNVRAKLVASTSIDQLSGHARTQPTTPQSDLIGKEMN